MTVKDLDAKRAARSEARNEPHEVILGGETFELPAELPMEALDLMGEAKFRPAFALVFEEDRDEDGEATPAGGAVTARFFRHRPTTADLEEIMGLYGKPGESSASPTSLLNGGRPSSETGEGTMGVASDRTAMALALGQAELARTNSARGRSST
jgi:hypothetical protein